MGKKFSLASLLDGYSDTSVRPNSNYRRMLFSLQGRWRHSTLRIVAGESYKFCLRIRAILRKPTLRYQVAIPLAPMVDSDSFVQNQYFARACSDHILKQSALCPWMSFLDLERLGLAFQAGSQWAFRKQDNSVADEVLHS